MFRTSGAEAFFAAWTALRENNSIPHYRTLFQHLSSELIPHLVILEEVDDDFVFRFMGTYFVELRGKDLTGDNRLALLPPKQAAATREFLSTILDFSCGLWTRSLYAAPPRSDFEIETIILPTANDLNKPRRILAYGHLLRAGTFVSGKKTLGHAERAWIDIGSGVPKNLPDM